MPQLIFKSLYSPQFIFGVPMAFILAEVFICLFAILIGVVGLLAIPPLLLIHAALARLLSSDSQILKILLDIALLPPYERK